MRFQAASFALLSAHRQASDDRSADFVCHGGSAFRDDDLAHFIQVASLTPIVSCYFARVHLVSRLPTRKVAFLVIPSRNDTVFSDGNHVGDWNAGMSKTA